MSELLTLICSCCEQPTTGRQWYNRDLGYGLCAACASSIAASGKQTAEETRSCYGIEGVHYNVEQN